MGNTVYVTTADSNVVEKYDATSGASLVVAFTAAGAVKLSANRL